MNLPTAVQKARAKARKDRGPLSRMLATKLDNFSSYHRLDLERLGAVGTPLEAYEAMESMISRFDTEMRYYRSILTSIAYEVLERSK